MSDGESSYNLQEDAPDCEDYAQDIEEATQDNYKRHNPFRHIRFATEEARKLTREFGIREQCKQYFPPEPYEHIAE